MTRPERIRPPFRLIVDESTLPRPERGCSVLSAPARSAEKSQRPSVIRNTPNQSALPADSMNLLTDLGGYRRIILLRDLGATEADVVI